MRRSVAIAVALLAWGGPACAIDWDRAEAVMDEALDSAQARLTREPRLLRGTLPRLDGADSCRQGVTPLRDLALLRMWGRGPDGRLKLLDVVDVRGREGDVLSLEVRAAGTWRVWWVLEDSSGNRSCPSNVVTVETPPVAVGPVPEPGAGKLVIRPLLLRHDGTASCSWSQDRAGDARLELLDVGGRIVRVLDRRWRDAGVHHATLRVDPDVAPGIAWVLLRIDGRLVAWRRIVVLR